MNEQDEWPYWKAAISCLPTQEMRDAAWEFFVRHLAQNPKMADTFSGVILVMQANGLYMLKVPKLVHDEALVPLGREVSRLRDEMAETLSRHAEVTRDTFAVCEKTRQVAETAAKAAKELDDAIRHGWREVNTEELAVRIQGELETALLRPLVAQCRQVEEMTPALRDAADHTTFDYYADGVSPTTAILPRGWEDRLVRFSNENTNGAVAHCLDPLDLAYAKLAAGRPKDLDYVVELTRYHFIKPSALSSLVEQVEDSALKAAMTERWQVVQAKKLAREKPSIRPPGMKM